MNVYRVAPEPLPSLIDIIGNAYASATVHTASGPWFNHGLFEAALESNYMEQKARDLAASAPCPPLPPGANPHARGELPYLPPPAKGSPPVAPANVPE